MNKCEKLKIHHAWENCTPNIVYPTYPPQYPPKQEKCRNCKLVRTFYERTEEWIEYSDGVKRDEPVGFDILDIDIVGDGTTTMDVSH